MTLDIQSIKDRLAGATAEMDQLQALIEESRVLFPDNPVFMDRLDQMRAELDDRRARSRSLWDIADIVEK